MVYDEEQNRPNPFQPRVVLITGPTGIGKTHMALEFARCLGAEIVSADSMQVYRFMDIGTDKPELKVRQEIVHHLIDVVDPDEEFNAGLYIRLATPIIEDLWKKGTPILLVGGTGLYIKVLLGGLINGAAPRPDLRKRYREEAENKGKESLYKRLSHLDSNAARSIHPNDLFRIIRALEVIDVTGEPLSSRQNRHGFLNRPYKVLKIGLMVDRDKLYREIEARVDRMIEKGFVDEVRTLFKKGYGLRHRSMRGLGYRHLSRFILGEWSFMEAIEWMKRDTRRYAKRQITWFRSDIEIEWFGPDNEQEIEDRMKEFLFPLS